MIIKVGDDLITGIKKIDEQHEVLFNAVNKMAIIKDNKQILWQIIIDIENYANTHFDTEEKHMTELLYPEIEEHKQEHKLFLEKFAKLKTQIEEQGLPDSFISQFQTFLVEWIAKHYANIDIKMAKYFRENAL